MEQNPIHSIDILHGVPTMFKDLLREVLEQVEAHNHEAINR